MCDQQSLRPACAYSQSDQSLCLSLEDSMSVKLLAEQHLEFLSLKGAAQVRLSLHLSKCYIVGNHMLRLNCFFTLTFVSKVIPIIVNLFGHLHTIDSQCRKYEPLTSKNVGIRLKK